MIDINLIENCEKELEPQFKAAEDIALYNQKKVLDAFKKHRIALRHFAPSTGYGYGDEGRDALNAVFADIFGAEAAVCSPTITCGTHAISLCLYGVLRPGDVVLSITGEPYDTLKDVVNGEGGGTLKDYGIKFESIPLIDGKIDEKKIAEYFAKRTVPKMVYMQRSRGYEWRSALSVPEIENAVIFLRKIGFSGCVMLDNCYGEFIEKKEATEIGVNLLAGSLIKNPGGGIVPTGGYFAGDKKYVELVQNRLTSPSIGGEVGSYAFGYQYYFQGLFMAPHIVLQAVKGALLYASVLEKMGYKTSPAAGVMPKDIITSIRFEDRKKLISFIQGIQRNSPVDSFVSAEPSEMPGYNDEVIMAAGCFVQGASIELSADAPIRPPYIAYFQGGLTYEHLKLTLMNMDL
jgi:aluminum resistance protein